MHTNLGPGVVRFVGFQQHTDPKNPIIGVELVSRNGLNNGATRGFRYFECEHGYGALMRSKHIALPVHQDAALKIQANFRGMIARRESEVALEARRKIQRNELYEFEEGTAVSMTPFPEKGYSLDLIGSEVTTALGPGTLRFIGFVQHVNPPRQSLGVELVSPLGTNDGSIQGFRYFKCSPNHGALLDSKHVQVSEIVAATKIQAGFRGMIARKQSKQLQEEAVERAAAVKIQASFRGMKGRRLSRDLKDDSSVQQSKGSTEARETVECKAVPEHGLQLSTIGMQVDTNMGSGVIRFVG